MGINLLKTKIKSKSGGNNTGTYNTSNTMLDESILFNENEFGDGDKKQMLTGVFIILICVAGAYFFSNFAKGKTEGAIAKIRATNDKIMSEIEMKKNQIKDVEVFKGQSEEFFRKIQAIRLLSKTRLIELKALDLIQSITPDKVWFNKIRYSDFSFNFQGNAISRDDFDILVAELKNSNFFVQVVPSKITKSSSQNRNLWDFILDAELRREN